MNKGSNGWWWALNRKPCHHITRYHFKRCTSPQNDQTTTDILCRHHFMNNRKHKRWYNVTYFCSIYSIITVHTVTIKGPMLSHVVVLNLNIFLTIWISPLLFCGPLSVLAIYSRSPVPLFTLCTHGSDLLQGKQKESLSVWDVIPARSLLAMLSCQVKQPNPEVPPLQQSCKLPCLQLLYQHKSVYTVTASHKQHIYFTRDYEKHKWKQFSHCGTSNMQW